METKDFNVIIEKQMETCKDVLINKAKEYATEDRLHNFKVAAELQNCTPKQALAGFMAKHTVSVYDMCGSDETFPVAQWDEKITDHINYLLILRALVEEEINEFKDTEASDWCAQYNKDDLCVTP